MRFLGLVIVDLVIVDLVIVDLVVVDLVIAGERQFGAPTTVECRLVR